MIDLPEKLRPYAFLGLHPIFKPGDENAYASCPFCTREKKLGINIDTGQYHCVVCDEGGNIYSFMKRLWEECRIPGLEAFAGGRWLQPYTIKLWGIKFNHLTHNWMVPGFNAEKALTGLYLYVNDGERWKLLPTPTLGHHLFGVNLFDRAKPKLWLCEGIWDGMALYEGLKATGRYEASNVLAIPAALVWYDSWLTLFENREVTLCCQNDHPKLNPATGKFVPPASWSGMKKIYLAIKDKAKSVNLIQWGENGYSKDLPSGYDIRDLLNA